MNRALAKQLAIALNRYAKTGVPEFSLRRVHGPGPLGGLHDWYDGKDHLGSYLAKRDDGDTLHLILLDFLSRRDFYLVVYRHGPSNPIVQVHDAVPDTLSPFSLQWTYKPARRDARNPERLAYFERFAGDRTVTISIPAAQADVPRFLKDVFDLVDMRLRADALDSTTPDPRSEFPEGAVLERLHKSRERNSTLVAQVKREAQARTGRLACSVCDFDFSVSYGALGAGFIEAHHLVPLSELHSATVSTPKDLVLLCANCHRMAHRRRPWLNRQSLKGILAVPKGRLG